MVHRGKNSKEHNARYVARRIVWNLAFYDRLQGEVVNKLTRQQLLDETAKEVTDEQLTCNVQVVEEGEVIRASKGECPFQKLLDTENEE